VDLIIGLVDNLVAYFFFMAIATSFVPLPDFPVILHLATLGTYPAWLIALIGGLGTCAAGLIDYIFVTEVRKLKRVDKLLQHRHYQTMEFYFRKIAFISLILSGFLVFIPFDPFKLLAATARYDKYKYVLAIFIGRAPRYYLIALLGEQVDFPPDLLVWTFVVLAAIPLIHYLWKKCRENRPKAAA
jgi:membrane protein YqaA with SNARE-associated domain